MGGVWILLLTTAAGAGAGWFLKKQYSSRNHYLENAADVLGRIRLMLMEERHGMPQLLLESARHSRQEDAFAHRMAHTAALIKQKPYCSLENAYISAAEQIPVRGERKQERQLMQTLFRQLGFGTAAMREQAVAAALRRLKPLREEAAHKAAAGGRLCLQLGVLFGLMVGILLW